MRLNLESLPARDLPAVLASSGGVLFRLDDGGSVTEIARPFGAGAEAVPLHIAQVDGDVWIGAGVGGGPRVVRLDYRTWETTLSVFVGDPASRTGVEVAAFEAYRSPLRAESFAYPFAADTARLQQAIDRLPPQLAADLADAGLRVIVHSATGIGTLPGYPPYAAHRTAYEHPAILMHRDDAIFPHLAYEAGHPTFLLLLTDAERETYRTVHAHGRNDGNYGFSADFRQVLLGHSTGDSSRDEWFRVLFTNHGW